MNKQDWLAQLQTFAQTTYQTYPIPERKALSEEENWHCRIIGGELISWYQHHLKSILQERMVLKIQQFDPEPILVFTTEMAGLVAAREIIQTPIDSFIYLLHSEFEQWEKQYPVDEFKFHIHHWSYFQPISLSLLDQASQAYPEVESHEFRIHTSGDLWGEQCGVSGNHLWRWNGQKMDLLEDAFEQISF